MKDEVYYPGDNIEFIDDNTKGTVAGIINKEQILVNIEGLVVPVFTSQIVKTARNADRASSLEEKYNLISQKKGIVPEKLKNEIKVCFLNTGKTNTYSIIICNESYQHLFFTLYLQTNNEITDSCKAELSPNAKILTHNLRIDETHNYNLSLCFLLYEDHPKEIIKPTQIGFMVDEKLTARKKEFVPELGKEAIVVRIQTKKKLDFSGQKIEKEEKALPKEQHQVEKPINVIDLHIEKICKDFSRMTRTEMLEYQFNHFLNALEKGYAFGFSKMTFIHGIGTSVLKKRIYEYLKKQDYISAVSESDVHKYGFGALDVIFKK